MTTVDPALWVTAIDPFDKPLQVTFVGTPLTVTLIGSVIVTVAVAVQKPLAFPFGAVAVRVYVSGGKPVDPTTVFDELVMTTVEPVVCVTAIDPFEAPLQPTFVGTPLTVTWIGSVMVTGAVAVQ
jgi:hypothetical protein